MRPLNRYRVSVHQQTWWVLIEVDPDLLKLQLADADPLELPYGIAADTPEDVRESKIVMGFAHSAINGMAICGGVEFDEHDTIEHEYWTILALERLAIRQIKPAQSIKVIAANVRLPRESNLSVWLIKEEASHES